MASNEDATGLGDTPRDDWPGVTQAEADKSPIDRLTPGSDLHKKVLEHLQDRIKYSERSMSRFYGRWRFNEARVQAYVTLPDYEQQLKEMNENHAPPAAISIVVPYSFATLMTIATYHLHTFCGRRPMFQVGANKKETVQAAQNMEVVLQYNADHTRLVATMWQWFLDAQMYGVGAMRCTWKNQREWRTVWKKTPGFLGTGIGAKQEKTREKRMVYSGNAVSNIDPFMFLPDPRVPMTRVNKDGEYVFWREFMGRHQAKGLEADGVFKWVNAAGQMPRRQSTGSEQEGTSARDLLSGGVGHPGRDNVDANSIKNFMQADQGSVVIIPAELGLGESTRPEKWLFTILNGKQIVQAEKLELDHDMHPVIVTEPKSLGYGFGQAGFADFVGPLQDTLSWLINSHIHNVRSALNNMFIADPSRVEIGDVKNPAPGKVIRVKPAGYGQDVNTMLQQLAVTDITRAHVDDLQVFMRIADAISGVNDNIRGIQDAGGRKTATEVRTAGDAAASRLAAEARVISSQGVVDLTEQMCTNNQQFLEDELYLAIVGQDGVNNPIHISPEMLVGDFHYPVNDGTLPIDRVAMLDVWKEIFMGIVQNPQLSAQFDTAKIFEFIAELGGAKNLNNFRVAVAPDAEIASQAAAGNAIPISRAVPGRPVPQGAPDVSQTAGVVPHPGSRMAGGM